MPVLVTPASTDLGAALVLRLLASGGQVRAYDAGGKTAQLRAAGAMCASGTRDDEGRLEAAMEQVHTVIDVGGSILAGDLDQGRVEAATLVTAALGAGVKRIIALSVVGAAEDAASEYRRARGEYESLLELAPIPTVVIRLSVVDTPAMQAAMAGLSRIVADVTVAPISTSELIETLAFFDDVRTQSTDGHAVVQRCGPVTTVRAWLAADESDDSTSFVGRTYVPSAASPWLLEVLQDGGLAPETDLPDAGAL